MLNLKKKYLYLLIVGLSFIIISFILFIIFKDDIIKYNENRIKNNRLNYIKNDFSKQVTSSWYTMLNISFNIEDKVWSDNEKIFKLIEKSECNEKILKARIWRVWEKNFFAYKDLKCKKHSDNLFQFNYNLISWWSNDWEKITNFTKDQYREKDFIIYKTNDWIIKELPKDYQFVKQITNDLSVINNNYWEDRFYSITTSTWWQNKHKWLYSFFKIEDRSELDNIQLFNSWSTTEITLLDKDSTSAKKIIFDKEKLSNKTQNLAQVSCDLNWKCRDELKDVLSGYKIEKDYFWWSIIGNIKKWKITKVIVTPEKNNECNLDLKPYELNKFDPDSWEFKYNFALKWKNICPKSWAKFIVDLIAIDNKKYTLKTNIKWLFYDDSYRNMKFVKEKEEEIEIDFNVLKWKRPEIDGSDQYSDKIKYLWYLIVWDIKRYIHKFTWEEMWNTDFFIITDKKIKNAFDIEYLDVDSNKVWMPQVNLDRIRKHDNFVVINSFNWIEDLYKQQLLEWIDLSNQNILLEPLFSVYEWDWYGNDEKKILFDLKGYNNLYKKIEILWYKSLYKKDWKYFVKWKSNLMVPVSVTIKNDFYNKTLEWIKLWNDLVTINHWYVDLINIINWKYNFNSSFKNITILWYKDLYLKDNTLYLKWKKNFMIPVSIETKSEYKYKIENNLKWKNEVFLENNSKNILKISNNKSLEKIWELGDKELFQDKTNWCLFVSFENYPNFWLQYDFSSEDLKIKFLDNKDYWDYTFRFAWQASEIYQWVGNWQVRYWLETSSLKKCSHTVSQNDLKPDERLEKAWSYVGFPIYKFKDDNDPYLKRRFREQYWVERWQETWERYEEYVKSLPVLYWNDPFGRWLRVIKMVYMPQAEKMKPVIYLYPEETQKINVKVKPNWWFKLTIPEYPIDKWWDVISTPDSEITFEWETYPYLFWEWKAIWYEIWKKGFVIENNKESIENFLIEKLTLLWLNEIEIVDFNEYWIDRLSLVKNPFIFVTFASKEQQDWDSPLEVTPKPDSIIRVFMDYRWTDTKEKVEELDIITPVRKWFSVVEWGWAKRW